MSVSVNIATAFGGGALIGLAATLLLFLTGRIAGISGITAGLFQSSATEGRWRFAFIAGLLAAAIVYSFWKDGLTVVLQAQGPLLWIAGLLVGLGSRLGGGCTSGHGVCGIARLSPRSITATVVFMAAGMGTVWLRGFLR